MLKYLPVCAALLLLAGCEQDRDPGFVCMTNCAHECQDGIKGDKCRMEMQQQRDDQDRDSRYDNNGYRDNGYPNGSYPNDGGYHSRY